jgi:hypothetical protein
MMTISRWAVDGGGRDGDIKEGKGSESRRGLRMLGGLLADGGVCFYDNLMTSCLIL